MFSLQNHIILHYQKIPKELSGQQGGASIRLITSSLIRMVLLAWCVEVLSWWWNSCSTYSSGAMSEHLWCSTDQFKSGKTWTWQTSESVLGRLDKIKGSWSTLLLLNHKENCTDLYLISLKANSLLENPYDKCHLHNNTFLLNRYLVLFTLKSIPLLLFPKHEPVQFIGPNCFTVSQTFYISILLTHK